MLKRLLITLLAIVSLFGSAAVLGAAGKPAIRSLPLLITQAPPQSPLRIIPMEVTAYCACKKCCGKNAQGITASGKHVSYNGGMFVAADTSVLPFGTKLLIPGYGQGNPVEVIDRGGAIKGNRLDVFFASHTEALKWGRQIVPVTIVSE